MLIETNSNSYNLLKPENPFAARQEGVTVDFNRSQAFLFGEFDMSKFIRKDSIAPLCACGCEEKVIWNRGGLNKWNKFIHGHNRRRDDFQKKPSNSKAPLCACGHCKKQVKWSEEGNKWDKYLYGHNRKGKKASEKAKAKMANAKIGKKASEKTKQKMSKSHEGKNNAMYGVCGPLASNWKGGIAAEPYCDIWLDEDYKESIKERDNYECQNPDCRNNSNHLSLTIHHVDYIKKNCHPWNLISLCTSCNSRANFNRNDWTNFYQGILSKKYNYAYNQHVIR